MPVDLERPLGSNFGVTWIAALVGALVLAPTEARADDDVESGVRAYFEADFEGALAAFARAETAEDLDRDGLVRLLFFRALVHQAFGSDAARDADLARLGSLEPDHPLSDAPESFSRVEAPAPVRESFERLRARRLGVRVSADRTPDGAIVRVRVENDPGGLARRIELSAGVGRRGEATGDELAVTGPPGARIEYGVRVLGPGGAVLAERSDRDEPIAIPADAREVAASGEDDGGLGAGLWIGLGAGALVLAAGGIVLFFVLSGAERTQFGAPAFER